METDREILCWLYRRLALRYDESELYDWMHRLHWIIYATDPKKVSRGQKVKDTCNSSSELLKLLKEPTDFETDMLSQ